MFKFSNDIYELEKINISKTPTISSVAFKALTTNYLKSGLLYQVKGRAHDNMREAYYGGITEVYNLKTDKSGFKIYDINSSYPASMMQTMPVGKPVFSTDPRGLDNYFGIVYAEVESPKDSKGDFINIKYPPLPFRLPEGRIINAIGN